MMRFLVLFLSLTALLCSALVIPDQEALKEDFFLADRADHLKISTQTSLERDDDGPPPDFGPRPRPYPSKPHPPHIYPPFNGTLWQLINQNRRTARLAELLSHEANLVTLLNDTQANYTIFAPTNHAIKKFLDHNGPPQSWSNILAYHIVNGSFAKRLLKRHQTLPTALNETGLGHDLPQRLVVDIRDGKIRLNRHSKVLRHEIITTNGILYHAKHVLVPPPTTQTLLNIPSHLSTFAFALSKTNLADYLLPQFRNGGMTFAPTNHAFHKLGKRANRFLFSPEGEQCLRNQMQYHLVPNQTLYSDTLYDADGKVEEFGSGGEVSVHVELPTLFQEQKLYVDIMLGAGGAKLRVNGVHRVKKSDFLASDGVVHVLKRVLVPLKKVDGDGGQYADHTDEGAMILEELKDQVAGCGGKGRLEL